MVLSSSRGLFALGGGSSYSVEVDCGWQGLIVAIHSEMSRDS